MYYLKLVGRQIFQQIAYWQIRQTTRKNLVDSLIKPNNHV